MARGQLSHGQSEDAPADEELADAFAAFGLECDDSVVIDQDEFWLWPENEGVYWLWRGLQTQWTVAMNGAVGLNYAGVESGLRMSGIANKKRRKIFPLIQHMEIATLDEWAAKR